jgi:hypothetical protein
MSFLAKGVFFSQDRIPQKKYYVDINGRIELFPLEMTTHPKYGDPLFPVTKEIIYKFENQDKIPTYASEEYFSNKGEPVRRYYKNMSGKIELFPLEITHHPKYGDSLRLITKEIIIEYEKQNIRTVRSAGEVQHNTDTSIIVISHLKQERDSLEALNNELQKNQSNPETQGKIKSPPPVQRAISQPIKWPDVSGSWIGEAKDISITYSVIATFVADQNGGITGNFLWQDGRGHATEHFRGYINQQRELHFTGFKLEDIVTPRTHYILGDYYATLSKSGDSLIGGWTAGDAGKFILRKQPVPGNNTSN